MPSIVIVGASRGIGREFVRQYAEAGWNVVATARSPEALADLAGQPNVAAHQADSTDEASLHALAASEPGPHDAIVVVAGAYLGDNRLADIERDAWLGLMEVNALGPLLAARALGGTLRDGGVFVALTSQLGSIGDNTGGGLYSYRMSKAALNAGMRNVAYELKRRSIAVAALHPGWVKTDMGGPGAQVEPADSVRGLRQVIEGLHERKPGGFYDFRGAELPW